MRKNVRRARRLVPSDLFAEEQAELGDTVSPSLWTGKKSRRYSEILRLLSKSGPMNATSICRSLAPKYGSVPSVFYAIKDLNDKEWVHEAEVRPAQGPRGESVLYDLTLKGLMAVISSIDPREESPITYAKLANKYQELIPGVFGLWEEVRESGAEYEAQIQLHRTANYLLRLIASRSGWGNQEVGWMSISKHRKESEQSLSRDEKWKTQFWDDEIAGTQDLLSGYFLGTTMRRFLSHAESLRLFHRHDIGSDEEGTRVASDYDRWLAQIGRNEVLRTAAVRSLFKELSIIFKRQVDDAQSKIEGLAKHGISPLLERAEDIAAARELIDDLNSLRTVIASLYTQH